MQQTFSTSQKVKQFVFILFPILVTQFGMFSMTFFDTMMSGRVSADDLAGVAIGSSFMGTCFYRAKRDFNVYYANCCTACRS